jgi:transposase
MHSLDVKYKAIVHYTHFCKSLRRVAKLYGIGKSTLQRWVNAKKSHSDLRRAKKPASRLALMAIVKRTLEANPFSTMSVIVQSLKAACGVVVSPSTASRIVKQTGFTKKKAFRTSSSPYDPQRVLSHAYNTSRDDVICVDEACFYLGDHPKTGYAPKGRRLNVASNPCLRRKKLTLIMAVGRSGVLYYDISDCNVNKMLFLDFIKRLPCPPGTVVLMDNVAFHHSKETQSVLEAKGVAPLFTPPYSPRLNAIENVFGVLKQTYRSNCPISFDNTFDYVSLFHACVACFGDCSRYFERVDRLVNATIADGATTFLGVD